MTEYPAGQVEANGVTVPVLVDDQGKKRAEYNWLRTLIAAVRPEGVPTLPVRVTAIENDDLDEEG